MYWPINWKCLIPLSPTGCWYRRTLIYRGKEHGCVLVPRVNIVPNKVFFVLHTCTQTYVTKKHSVAQYKGGLSVARYRFFYFFLNYWSTAQWHCQYSSSQTRLPVQTLIMPPPLMSLFTTTGTAAEPPQKKEWVVNKHISRFNDFWLTVNPKRQHANSCTTSGSWNMQHYCLLQLTQHAISAVNVSLKQHAHPGHAALSIQHRLLIHLIRAQTSPFFCHAAFGDRDWEQLTFGISASKRLGRGALGVEGNKRGSAEMIG